ncbi:hypothetical protein KIH27_02200 [Mycobacterium sp. M1]|uniref:Uncharacterized protein n=1 Tax=Mycolicibacter acidiphilus TaxID=2835306 RepID=A0ABS5RDN4_9MYCO|nr:hypothetical protein [Mycolicibacter acidiphilus]MBS9532397.1 hypothetical protein [Mycolicibacter acidiphilus]
MNPLVEVSIAGVVGFGMALVAFGIIWGVVAVTVPRVRRAYDRWVERKSV